MPLPARERSCFFQFARMMPRAAWELVPSNKCPSSCAITNPGWAQARHKHIRMTSDSVVAQKRQSKRRLVPLEGLLPKADFEVLRERRLAARRPLFAGLG